MRQYFVFLFKMTTLTFPHLLLWLRHNCLVNNVGLTDSCFYTSQWHGTAVRSFQSFQIPLDLSFFEFHIFEHTQQLYNAIHLSIRINTITILLLWTWCLKTQKGSSSLATSSSTHKRSTQQQHHHTTPGRHCYPAGAGAATRNTSSKKSKF